MPNGRSGSLVLNKTEFASWLSVRDGHEFIGRSLVPPENERVKVSVQMMAGMLATYPADRITVEEHDSCAYIIYMFDWARPAPERLILIEPDSPLFQELRRQHDQQGRRGTGSL